MILRGILFVLAVAAYVIPLLVMSYVGIRARRSKAFADKIGILTKGDMQQFTLVTFIPIINLFMLYYFILDTLQRGKRDNTPLHK